MKLIVNNLSGERAGQLVFSNINFNLDAGDALIIIGSNGSGKSTLLRIITGLLPPASGSIIIEGKSDDDDSLLVGEHMHYLGHLNGLKPALNIEENLTFWRDFL